MKMIAQLPDHLFSMAAQLFDLGYKDVADETTNLFQFRFYYSDCSIN